MLDKLHQDRVDNMKLMIATPFYKKEAYVPYIGSLLSVVRALEFLKIKWVWSEVCGDAYVDRAKNSIIAHFLDHPDKCTDLIMIDSDLGWDLEGFLALLFADEEFVGGVYPNKTDGEYSVQLPPGTVTGNFGAGLIEATWIPGGFTHWKRSCLEKMTAAYADNSYTDTKAAHTKKTVNLYECRVHDGLRFGEDVEFCKKWRDIGGKIWIEPRITFEHVGTDVKRGCFRADYVQRSLKDYVFGRLSKELTSMGVEQ